MKVFDRYFSITQKYSAFWRSYVFWKIDQLNHGEMRQHYIDISQAFVDPLKAHEQVQSRLLSLIKHAKETTNYYQDYDETSDYTDLPVIEKDLIRERFNDFISIKYDRQNLGTLSTSGSYGIPFIFYVTREKIKRQHAEILYFNEWAGYNLGARMIQLRVFERSWLYFFSQNCRKIDPKRIDKSWYEKSRKIIKNRRNHFLVGYPGALIQLARYCEEKGDGPQDFTFKGIVCSAEPMTTDMRNTFNRVFGCPIYDRYAAVELGVIAHDCPKCGLRHVNFPSYYVELLKLDKNEPVEPGEIGRVVVTDLFSHAMPLIRYNTGDLASWVTKGRCNDLYPTLSRIDGRCREIIYAVDKTLVYPSSINNAIADHGNEKELLQYQFVQTGDKEYVLKLVVTSAFDHQEILENRLRELIGKNANLRFEYVDNIPPLSSGKRPLIYNTLGEHFN